MKILPTLSQQYRPTSTQWKKLVEETELEPYCHYSKLELINFKTSKIHLKGGAMLAFDCLSEAQYLHVINGGYYEYAPPIDETKRI